MSVMTPPSSSKIKLKKSLDTLPKKEYPLQPRLVHSSEPHLPAYGINSVFPFDLKI